LMSSFSMECNPECFEDCGPDPDCACLESCLLDLTECSSTQAERAMEYVEGKCGDMSSRMLAWGDDLCHPALRISMKARNPEKQRSKWAYGYCGTSHVLPWSYAREDYGNRHGNLLGPNATDQTWERNLWESDEISLSCKQFTECVESSAGQNSCTWEWIRNWWGGSWQRSCSNVGLLSCLNSHKKRLKDLAPSRVNCKTKPSGVYAWWDTRPRCNHKTVDKRGLWPASVLSNGLSLVPGILPPRCNGRDRELYARHQAIEELSTLFNEYRHILRW